MTDRLRVAVLSFAHIHAASYLHVLAHRPDVELLGCDPEWVLTPAEPGRGPEPAADLGIAYADSWTDAFAWRPDAVIVCAENSRHRGLVERAIVAGADVLCEKPLATTVEDARAMVAAAELAGVRLMTAFPVRFAPSYAALRDRVARGDVGEVLGIVATNNGKIPSGDRAWFVDPDLAGGGALVDHVVHCSDLIEGLLGARPLTVRAVTNTVLHANRAARVETGGLVTVGYEGGVVATIDCSWSQPLDAPTWGGLTLEVYGTAGSIAIDPFGGRVEGFGAEGALWLPLGSDLDAVMLEEFLDAVRERRPPTPDGHAGLRAVEIMTAAQESATCGDVVRLGAA